MRPNYAVTYQPPVGQASWRQWLLALSREQRLVCAGLLLALLLLILLYLVLAGNVAQARSQQQAREQRFQERQRCDILKHWRERAACVRETAPPPVSPR